MSSDTWLEIAILLAILIEIILEARWQAEARRWHQEEMTQWQLENSNLKKGNSN